MKTRILLRGIAISAASLLFACSGTQGTGDESPDANAEIAGAQDPNGTGKGGTPQHPGLDGQDRAPVNVDQQRREFLVTEGLEAAGRSIQLKLYDQALRQSADVLEIEPQNQEARGIFLAASQALGDDVSRVAAQTQDQITKVRISIERDRFRAMQLAQQADAEVELSRYGAAVDDYEKALLILHYNPFMDPGTELEREIQRKLDMAQRERAAAMRDAELAAEAQSRADLEESERKMRMERQERVTRLMVQANRNFQLGNYNATVDLLNLALSMEPNNVQAQELYDLASRAQHDNKMEFNRQRWKAAWTKVFDDLNMAFLPQTEYVAWDLERWAIVSQRKPASFSIEEHSDSPEERAIMAALEDTSLEHNFSDAGINDWASFYASVTQVNFVVAPSARELDEETTRLTEFRLPSMSVAKALNVITSQTGVKWHVRDGVVELVSSETPIGRTYLVPYQVHDLVLGIRDQPGPKLKLSYSDDDDSFFDDEDPAPTVVDEGRLQDLIRNNIDPDSWDEGIGTMNYQSGVLLIRHTSEVHKKVEKMLTDLRRAVGIQVDVEARFLKVEDNFLEDIGVDFRGLGDQSSEGVPGRGLAGDNVRFDDFGRPEEINAASPSEIGTGTEPGIFYDDGADGSLMARTENLYDTELGGGPGRPENSGGLSLQYTYLDDTELEVVLRAVQKKERSEQIVAPRLLVFNNTRAHMQALRHTSYIGDFDAEIAQSSAVAQPIVDVIRDGVVLDVRPVVSADRRFITMELRPTVMQLQQPIQTFTTSLGSGQPVSIQLPRVTLQSVRTTVTMPDGGSILLGGMKLAERQTQVSGVPILMDIPLLGFFFSRKGTFTSNMRIIILMRARIVIPAEYEPELVDDDYELMLQNG